MKEEEKEEEEVSKLALPQLLKLTNMIPKSRQRDATFPHLDAFVAFQYRLLYPKSYYQSSLHGALICQRLFDRINRCNSEQGQTSAEEV